MRVLQTLDIKDNCSGIYYFGNILLNFDESKISDFEFRWKHSPNVDSDDQSLTYLYVLSRGLGLRSFSPNPEYFDDCERQISLHRKAATTAKVNLGNECLFSLIPEHRLKKFFSSRQDALESCLTRTDKEEDYEILHKAHVLTSEISARDIIFKEATSRIKYNIFGSATGRLTTEKNSLPILNLKKEQRKYLKPQNDAFVELDLNAAEIRMLMALSGKSQPQGDIHEHLQKEIFGGWGKRSEFKERLFAWLYNPNSDDTVFDDFFSRQTFRDFFAAEDEVLRTPFGRRLNVDERKAQNYLLQSTTSDQVIENAYNIQKMLKNKKTKIAFTLHDSIVLDMSQEDAIMLREIKDKFEQTRWGPFVSTCKIGTNFGELKEIKI